MGEIGVSRAFPANRIRMAMAASRKATGVLMTFPAPYVIELFGHHGGFDFAYADGEHGAFDLKDLDEHCRACDLVGLTAIARIPEISRGTVTRYLDRGFRGIIAPHVETAEEARQLVDYCRFHPEGTRSYGAGRAERLGVDLDLVDHGRQWNASVFIGVMIESRSGIDNLETILAVDGVDYFMTGANDLAQALGHPGEPRHPDVLAVQEAIEDQVHAAGKLMREDIMRPIWLRELLLDGARRYLAQG